MYKFTVFTIIFSTIVVVVVVNLVMTDFRNEKPGSQLVTNNGLSPSPTSISLVEEVNENLKVKVRMGVAEKSADDFSGDFLINAGVESKSIVSRPFTERIFTILSPSGSGVLGIQKYFLNAGDLEGVEAYEIKLADEESAMRLYNEFANVSANSILYSINTNDGFGDRSFYLNDQLKSDFVFLIILRRNVIYAFAYSKEKHDKMITIFNNLQ